MVRLQDRIDAVSTVIGDWFLFLGIVGLAIIFFAALDGKFEDVPVLFAVWVVVVGVLTIPMIVLGAAKAILTLRAAWRTGRRETD